MATPISVDNNVEEALRESEARYRLLAEYATDMISRHDPTGIYLYVSPACRNLLGYEPEDLLGHSAYDFFHPADITEIQRSHLAITGEADMYTVEYRIRKKDGQYTWFETTSRAVWDETGEIREIIAVSRNISVRKRTEAALIESEERYRIVLEMTSDYTYAFQVDAEGQLTLSWVTDVFTRISGFTYSELRARGGWISLIHADDMPIIRQREERLLAGHIDISEFRIITRQGERRWLRDYGRPVWDEIQKRVVTIYGAGQDITQQKQAELALQESEERFRTLAQTTSAGIFIHQGKQFVYTNPAAEATTGYSHDELLAMNFWDIVHPDHQTLVRERSAARLRGEAPPTQYEFKFLKKSGETGWVDITTGLIEYKGQPAVIATTFDITEQKRVEETLAYARDQALEASRLKSELLARVSHELRTPLNAILGFGELFDMGVYGDLTGRQQKAILQIIESAAYLTKLVSELLNQAQLEAGHVKLTPTLSDLKDLIEAVQEKMGVIAQTKKVPLIITIAEDLPNILVMDQERVQQILFNLVGNAIKFTEHGTVTVKFYRSNAKEWAIDVSDTGVGIPGHEQQKIFEPFRQVDGSLTRKYGGSGLGLSIVKQLTELMGGNITVASEVGRGSTFTVRFPLLTTNGEPR